MPVYEYRCKDCKNKISIRMTYAEYDTAEPICTICESTQLVRLISKVQVLTSDDQRTARLSDPALFSGADENDPRSMGRLLRRLGDIAGDEVKGDEFSQVVERLEGGEAPESIQESLPAAPDSPAPAPPPPAAASSDD